MASLNIPITIDNLSEGIENFMLTINPSPLPSNVTVGNLSEATVSIGHIGCKHIVVVVASSGSYSPSPHLYLHNATLYS